MNDASQSKRPGWLVVSGNLALVAAALAIWLTWIDRPDPPSAGLDPSWQAVLGHAHAAGLTFGREIIFTHGPWGWLTSHFLMEEGLAGKWVWEVFGKLFLSAGTVLLTLRLPLARRIAFLVLLPAAGLFFPDTHFIAMLCLAVTLGLMAPGAPRAVVITIVLAIGFLSTMKFVYAVVGMSGVGLAVAGRLWDRQWRIALEMGAVAAISFLGAWMLSGQSLFTLPDHLRMSLELSAGYGGAMSLDESLSLFLTGAAAVLLIIGGCVLAIRAADRRMRWRIVPAAAFVAFATFAMWKHGFGRADGHVFALFNHAILIGVCAAPALDLRKIVDPFLLAAAAGLTGVYLWDAGLVAHTPTFLSAHLRGGSAYVFRPGSFREIYRASLESARRDASMPAIREVVGKKSIDVVNYQQGALLLNDLSYTGRPVIQSYAVYTPTLMRRNLRFFQRESAPEFVLWMHGTIDGRFPSQDDSLVLAELPRRYEPVLASHDSLLLRRRSTQPAVRDAPRELLAERTLAWGESFEIPGSYQTALWLQARLHPSRIGSLRSALYKPGIVTMIVRDFQEKESSYRIIPGIATEGFLIHPFLNSQQDVNAFAEGSSALAIRSVRFVPASPDERELWSRIDIRVSRLPDVVLQQTAPWEGYVTRGITTHAPSSVTSDVSVETLVEDAVPVVLLHSPGEMAFQIDFSMRCVAGIFGIRPGAYTGGATDGVEFAIEAGISGGTRVPVWNRFLNPVNDPRDRGAQTFEVCAPEGATHLYFITRPGPSGNADWDWSYFGNLRFASDATHR